MPSVILHENNIEYPVIYNPENPFVKITSIEFEDLKEGETNKNSISYILKNKSTEHSKIFDSEDLDLIIDMKQGGDLYFKVEKKTEDQPITIYYEIIDTIESKDISTDFNNHLSNSKNIKLFFSAPFGHGKSTFLENFFSKRTAEFNCFHLYPVNYSVADNKDIFEYIKAEILIQLSQKEIDLIDFTPTFLETIYLELGQEETLNTISNFVLNNIGELGTENIDSNVKLFGNLFLNIKNRLSQISKKHAYKESDRINSFLKGFNNQKGSLLEKDLITRLIKDLLHRLSSQRPIKKENVLIIDDLDRLDPDHIFRILNIFSAHYENKKDSETNKFGFDKIILVGDLKNIKSIYRHKFGKKTDFNGYIKKFYSISPFEFDLKKEINSYCVDIDNKQQNYLESNNPAELILAELLEYLNNAGLIGFRDLIKLRNIGFQNTINKCLNTPLSNSNLNSFNSSPFYPIFYFLNELDLLSKLRELKINHTENNINYRLFCLYLIQLNIHDSKGEYFYRLLNTQKTISFDTFKSSNHSFTDPVNFKILLNELMTPKDINSKDINFTYEDFSKLFITALDKFEQG